MFNLDLKRAEVALASGRLEDVCKLARQADVRQHRDGQRLIDALIEALLIRASQHIDFDRIEDARQDAALAFEFGGRKPEVAETVKQIVNRLSQRGVEELNSGRLDRAMITDQLLATLRHHSTLALELHENCKRCREIQEHIQASRYTQAERTIAVLGQTLPDANWIELARTSLADAIQSIHRVMSGPIGLLATGMQSTHFHPRMETRRESSGLPVDRSRSYLLQVDGLGSMLLHLSDRLTIGSASSSSRFDVPIQTDGLKAPLEIRRDGDDYFVDSQTSFVVNEQATTRRLLSSGDHVSFGQRGRFRFVKAVPASASAILQITGAGLSRRDIRSIVLLADSLLFAPSGGHFCIANESCPVVLYWQGDALTIRSTSLRSGAEAASQVQPLNVGDSVVVGATRFALLPFTSR